ncbi:MAG: chromosomal replication initiator protein DnaA [Oligoflexales bacterium]|nr:chromosomal replication initiator protein DnaA [Oligoflexales bacterium]
MNALELWNQVKEKLKSFLDAEQYQNWIEPLQIKEVLNNEIVIGIPNLVFYQGILDEYLEKIEYCKTLAGADQLLIRFDVESNKFTQLLNPSNSNNPSNYNHDMGEALHQQFNNNFEQMDSSIESYPEISALSVEQKAAQNSTPKLTVSRSLSNKSHLNSNYTFSTYVRGPSNQFSYATCMNAAENPGKTYNPLFIYGATGLGKTHLMHAVGNKILDLNPDSKVIYISSERFMNEMIYCIRFNKMWDFRQKYRNCDAFLVDDIQFISHKKSTQEEFFHTFNSLYEAKKQIVITSDMFPQDIPDIEERLRNRFQWGLIADIQPPDMEHRMAILLNKADQLGIHLSSDVAEFIATNAKRNVRELEGALHRITAFAALQGRQIDITLASEIFQNVLSEPPKRLTIESIQKVVADYFKIKIVDIKGKKRHKALTTPRQIAMYLSRNMTKASFPEIGEKFGGKDHTTVMHAVKKVQKEITANYELKSNIESLERQLEQIS